MNMLHNLLEKIMMHIAKILGVVGGIILAVLFITVGFWKTMLVILLAGLGLLIGFIIDDKQGFEGRLGKLLSGRKRQE